MNTINISDRINSPETSRLTAELSNIAGFSSSRATATDYPILESDECPRKAFEILRNFGIPVPYNNQEDQPDPDGDQVFSPKSTVVVMDVLGRYYSNVEQIVLFTRLIKACADAMNVSEKVLCEIVMAHEIAHAITHRTTIKGVENWKNRTYAETMLSEGLLSC